MRNDLQSRIVTGFGRFGGRLAVILIGLGLLSIAIAWNSAAGTTYLQEQVALLISGGLVGMALVGVGCALMIMQAFREERAKLETKLDELIGAVQRSGDGGSAAPRDLTGLVVAGSASFHVPGCRLVDGREEVDYLTADEARARFLQPCRVCQPDNSNVTVV